MHKYAQVNCVCTVRPVSEPMDDFYYVAGRGVAYGLGLLEALYNVSSTPGQARLHGVVRGHQHNNAAGMSC